MEAGPEDSISIRGDIDPEAVIEFLRHPVPWCEHCDMESREFYTWGRSSRSIEEWTKSRCGDEADATGNGRPDVESEIGMPG